MIATNIWNAIELLKYILSCQSWGDNEIGTVSPTAKIKTGTGEGSFDSTDLDFVRNRFCHFQVSDVEKSNTDDLIKKICKQFSLIQYTDKDGYECVKYLFAGDSSAPLFVIDDTTETDSYEPPDATRICINPTVKYGYDYATKEYARQLSIQNVQMGTFNAAYTAGFSGTDGLTCWNLCKEKLWPHVKHFEEMDDELAENEFIVDYEGAVWRLQNIIKLMSASKFSFTVPFTSGKFVVAGDLIRVQFAHLSASGTDILNAIVNSVSLSKNSNSCTLNVTFLDDIEIDIMQSLQDTTNESNIKYQDSFDLQKLNFGASYSAPGIAVKMAYTEPTATNVHITMINDSLATLTAEMDPCQNAIVTDLPDRPIMYTDDTGVKRFLYGSTGLSKSLYVDSVGNIYIYGTEGTLGAVRFRYDSVTGTLYLQKQISLTGTEVERWKNMFDFS